MLGWDVKARLGTVSGQHGRVSTPASGTDQTPQGEHRVTVD